MQIVDTCAPSAPIVFPVDLTTEVPDYAFIDGIRCRWDGKEQLVEVTDLRGEVLWQWAAPTLEDARRWCQSADWAEIAREHVESGKETHEEFLKDGGWQ